ncbi:HEAT repeat domain-containing protein [Myxococcota bacterium]|nr:HEAT repeat domain-containing protein [Myxococcota bacterium]MBU1533829.1 HEAT repeat domain-containing protein [Myxococcota bacterium]
MTVILLFCATFLSVDKPYLTDDPLFQLPSRPGYSKSYFANSITNFRKQKLGMLLYRAYKTPDSLEKEALTIEASQHDFLTAWGATGRKKAVRQLMFLLPNLDQKAWIQSALTGLAFSMNQQGHRFLVRNVGNYEISLHEITPILNAVAMKNPLELVPLLSNARLAQSAASVLLNVPSLAVEKALYQAAILSRVSFSTYVQYIGKTMRYFPRSRQTGICHRLFNVYQRVVASNASMGHYWKVLARCPGTIKDPRWLALLGEEETKLLMLKAMRNQKNRFFGAFLSKPIQDLMTEYIGSPGWERLFLSILGKITDDKSIKMVASYVLSPNLWLREEALASLAFGAHPTSGRMLHAAALESAGEEAVLYFAPYFFSIRNWSWQHKSMAPLEGVLKRYIKAKDKAYSNAAMFSLAWHPRGSYRSIWWPRAMDFHKELVKDKKWEALAGFLPVMANHPKSLPILRKALLHQSASVRGAAAFSLGRLKDTASTKRLFAMAQTLTENVAVNATWALGQLSGTRSLLRKLLQSGSVNVAGNAAMALMRKDATGTRSRFCSTFFTQFTRNRLSPTVLTRVVTWLKLRCVAQNDRFLYRFSATVPQYLVLSYYSGGDLDFLSNAALRPRVFFLRLLNRFHVGQVGKPYKINLESGEVLFGHTTFGGVVFYPGHVEPDAAVTWLN